jgi:carbon-monoxide dehydrogenase small subunit
MKNVEIVLTVNGKVHALHVDPKDNLSSVLRDRLHLLGTKEGCQTGECGSCTVLMDAQPVKSCLTWAVQAAGTHILTIEGLSSRDHPLHPVQKAFVEAGAIQCGFCTPGFVLSTYALLSTYPKPTDAQIKEGLAGHLCRCTGYETILKAVKLASENLATEHPMSTTRGN